ncbi:MAG: M14 family metallopeptidase, partial [Hungatella sp.]
MKPCCRINKNIRDIKVNHYHDYEELKTILQTLADAEPQLCRLICIGSTYEGREILLLEITNHNVGIMEEKTGYYAEACTHAEEFCGTNAALQLAVQLLSSFGKQEEITRLLNDTVFYIVPRVNPDGVETVIKTGMQGVSNGKYPLDERQLLPGLCPKDINNDHIVTQMRILDPDGEWKVSKKDSRLMVLRKPYEIQGEFYRMYPEGIIRGDIMGFDIPMPKDVNLNRNYPAHWQPEGMQYGACELPLSEPETKAVACFINLHPNIAGVISFHTNAGAIMRPFSNKGDENFVGADLSMYNALGAMGQEDLGYEVMSTYGGFTPDKTRIRGGTLSDWTFEFLGIPSFMLELWNVYDAAGSKRPPNFHFSPKDEDTDLEVLRFADREIGPSAYIDWQPIEHPQLGKVEVGGWNRIYVERNPPESYLQALS